jgi:hypothetical protein
LGKKADKREAREAAAKARDAAKVKKPHWTEREQSAPVGEPAEQSTPRGRRRLMPHSLITSLLLSLTS